MKNLFAVSKLLAVMLIIVGASGCASGAAHMFSPKSYKATEATFTSKDLDEQLHHAYVRKEIEAVENGSSSDGVTSTTLLDEKLMTAPTVVFINNDRKALDIVVRDTRGHKGSRKVWKFTAKPGETVVFPDDFPQAPTFRRENSYTLLYQRYNRWYETTFRVSAETRGWEGSRGVEYNGGVIIDH